MIEVHNALCKVDILAVGVHPDDVELGCIGTLIKQQQLGYTFGILDLTQGELGTRGTAETRRQEAKDSAMLSSAAFRVNLQMRDGFFEPTETNKLNIVKVIRACQPKIMLINAVSDRHPDHGRASQMTRDAAFLSGLLKIETIDFNGQPQEHYRPQKVYSYIQDHNLVPDFAVDISDTHELKIQCVKAFKTQFFQGNEDNDGVSTPISSASFLNYLTGRAASIGRHIGADYAEGFNSVTYLRVNNLFDTL